MAIIRTTQTIGLPIQEQGTREWGSILNDGLEKIDSAFLADRNRISSLETLGIGLPGALAGKIGHNLLRNNIFRIPVASSPNLAAFWTPQFYNGAIGNTTRDSSTQIQGSYSLRVSIVNVDTSPSAQTRPYPGLNILDPENDQPLATTDSRQLTNGFGVNYQSLSLLPRTTYTLSCYGKSDVQNLALGINNHWKVGIVFKSTTGDVLYSYFTQPQTNRTNLTTSSSFQRVELTFSTPNIPIVNAEIWMVCEGSTPGGIGSSWFGGVQLEQSQRASNLETFAFRGGDLFVDGDFIVSGNLTLQQQFLTFDSDEIKLLGNVQIGDSIVLDTLDVYTKQSTFYGPLTVQGNTVLGDSISDKLDVQVGTTTFFGNQDLINPQGGNVTIQGTLNAQGDVVLGSSSSTNTVTINANLVTTGNDLAINNNLDIGGSLTVDRGVELGSNQPLAGLVVKMTALGSRFEGDVVLDNNLNVKGSTTLGDSLVDNLVVNAGSASFAGSLSIDEALDVAGPVTFNMGSSGSDDLTISGNKIAASLASSVEFTTPILKTSNILQVNNGLTANLSLAGSSLGSSGGKLASLNIFSLTSSISDNLAVGGNLSLSGNLTSTGTSFQLGASFSANSLGQLTIGNIANFSSPSYGDQLRIYAGNTFFGDSSLQKRGNVEIGGNLQVSGNSILGSSTSEDTLTITASTIDVNLGSNFKIGGGFQNNTYNPLASDHGGITLDKNGNLSLDGKLTVKGPFDPVSILINPKKSDGSNTTNVLTVSSSTLSPTTTFNLTSLGELSLNKSFSLKNGTIANFTESNVSFGLALSPSLTTFDAYASFINLTGATTIDGSLATSGNLSAATITGSGDLLIAGNSSFQGDITSLGYDFTFGQSNDLASNFRIYANDVQIGVGSQNRGTLTVGNNLYVKNSFTVGDIGVYDGYIRLSGSKVDVDVGSNRPGGVELAGFRVGGGFQNKPYDALEINHGGVTIDAYGNIFADGDIFTRGSLSYDKLILTVGAGENPFNPVITIINNNENQNVTNLTIDGYGDIVTSSNLAVNGGDITTSSTTFNLINETATTLNIGGEATTLTLGIATSTATYNLATGATVSGSTKTVNLATNGAAGSITNVNVGSPSGGTTTINNNLIVAGDLTVNGITTTVNTTNLEVKDNNIRLNNGGTDTSATNAGISIEGTADSTLANLLYDSSLASKFKIGANNLESEIITASTNQTIVGAKTLSSTLTITPTSGQLVLGATRTITLSAPTPAITSRTYTIPDVEADAYFVMTQGNQTIAGVKTFSADMNIAGNGQGVVPLGAIIPMTTGFTGAMVVPASGVVSNGWIRCDGSAIPAGNTVSGTTPNLTNSIYLRGASTYGETGGNNLTTLITQNLPSHSHTIDHNHAAFDSGSVDINHSHTINHDHAAASGSNTHSHQLPVHNQFENGNHQNQATVAGGEFGTVSATPRTYGETISISVDLPNFGGSSGSMSANNVHTHSIDVPNFTGSSGLTGTATAFSNEPNYINVIYLMRVK